MVEHDALAQLWLATLRDQAAAVRAAGISALHSEHALDEFFFDLLRESGVTGFLEVGAHDGQRAVRAKQVLPAARVIALEASPRNHQRFSSATDFEALGVEYLHLAASDRDAELTFHVEQDRDGFPAGDSSLLRRSAASGHLGTEVATHVVQGIRLDSLTDEMATVGLWIDVEGASHAVLAGASDTLSKTRLVKVEVEEVAFWSGQWLSHDVVAHLLKAGLVPVCRDLMHLPTIPQYNIVFVSPSVLSSPAFHVAHAAYQERLHRAPFKSVRAFVSQRPQLHAAARSGKAVLRRLSP